MIVQGILEKTTIANLEAAPHINSWIPERHHNEGIA